MKTFKRNLGKLSLAKLVIAKVGNVHSIYGGSIPKETDSCPITFRCGGDTIDTQ
ncbi:hypothetical protein H2O64_10830 [Kordia sp. YSTF-M3]|uniref:Uncharacterized protein n=1 Tax=Kordia aestuariivivens TaxID=2759037 RepID=A0ABR7Q9C5_9FLAO|nr:hypothetical protein [Kordia aestuariivivens]MBC8755169.1 hypothetical protein [Kordia aestuariivivens]